jgi:hypothetical protein
MKFVTRDLQKMLLSIGEFHENPRRQGGIFRMGVNEITFMRVL